jgi:SAM-dependent methyltransferase
MGKLAGHPDRERWNARYEGGHPVSFEPHPVAVRALSLDLPNGPVADLACGPGGSALLAAAAGRRVTAVDVSDVALGLLADEAARRGMSDLITVVQADLGAWRPEPGGYALVLCTGFWDRAVFGTAAGAVAAGGALGWEAFTTEARRARPGLCPGWCLGPGEPASLLPAGFEILDERDLPGSGKRAVLVRRHGAGREILACMADHNGQEMGLYQALKAVDEVAAALQAHLVEEHGADLERSAGQSSATDSLTLLRQARERLGEGLRAVDAGSIGQADGISLRNG